MYAAKVLADSITRDDAAHRPVRLLTVEVTMPRIVLAEFNTHRLFSRNSASSRAIPVVKQLRRVLEEPFIPDQFGTHRAGMQAGPPLEGKMRDQAITEWLRARDDAMRRVLALLTSPEEVARRDEVEIRSSWLDELAERLKEDPPADWLAVHKQIANRLLEPFMWHTVIVSSTEWENFFALRDHPHAQPEIRLAAQAMLGAMRASAPKELASGEYHLPLVDVAETPLSPQGTAEEWLRAAKISAGRCARVSFDRQGEYEPAEDSLARADRLLQSGHLSSFEHPATPDPTASGNFRGWRQYRAEVPHEKNLVGTLEERPSWEA